MQLHFTHGGTGTDSDSTYEGKANLSVKIVYSHSCIMANQSYLLGSHYTLLMGRPENGTNL